MSWKATAYVKTITENITASEKLLLFVLSDYYNDHKEYAWPSIKTLAEESLLSERQAQRLLADLEAKGFLARESRRGPKTSQYLFPGLTRQGVLSRKSDKTNEPARQDISGHQTRHSYVTQTVEQEQLKNFSEPPALVLNSEPPKNGNGDPRHSEFRTKLERFWKYYNPDFEFSWSAAEAGQLSTFLKKWPSLTVKQFCSWLKDYADSEKVVISKTPKEFLPSLHKYANGPLDGFGKPQDETA